MKVLTKNEIYDVLSGKSKVSYGATIQSIASYLSNGKETGRAIENEKQFKKQETKESVELSLLKAAK
jgi:hypothetical protein